jgi:hypothetical protein
MSRQVYQCSDSQIVARKQQDHSLGIYYDQIVFEKYSRAH